MPMQRVLNFEGGTPERVKEFYAELVMVLFRRWEFWVWITRRLLWHCLTPQFLEESLMMREKLMGQNIGLQRAKIMASMANEAMHDCRKMMMSLRDGNAWLVNCSDLIGFADEEFEGCGKRLPVDGGDWQIDDCGGQPWRGGADDIGAQGSVNPSWNGSNTYT
ncbi:hypothetical protein L1049_014169 [Liquidambar formosana]|uniref:Uncharacterized protein n=1 Tax=Liquidambar formosana TaxID=63359 RepID=A0AAP0WV11_LIQFO